MIACPMLLREEHTYTKQLAKMPTKIALEVADALDLYSQTGVGDVVMLKNMGGLRRLRVGKVRIKFLPVATPSGLLLALHDIKWRGDAYK